jgi:hypothetical protein
LIREWAYEDMTSDAENLDFQFIPEAEAGA